MVRNRPQLVPLILRTVFALEMPGEDDQITLASESYAAADPIELRCDSTVLLGFPDTPTTGSSWNRR
ncbi:hypothetical protein [Spirillospora albida]|uniref:hypothetical protein n=1 Tax=Spirillospora albida TaxID=58123 RepID=UPI0004BFAA15|nr:hypothetical protein [Spirillospora albida]